MKSNTVIFHSPIALENWGPDTPDTTGIGGSEVAHIEMVKRFYTKGIKNVISSAPVTESFVHNGIPWVPLDRTKLGPNQTWFVYRDISFFKQEKPADSNWIFIAQDVDYQWNEELLSKVDRYVTLCTKHTTYTGQRYPVIKDRITQSTNGIDPVLFSDRWAKKIKRNPYKIIYSSSPDRGLLLILQNWFRIKERLPKAELHVFYGFNNMEEILRRDSRGSMAGTKAHKDAVERLLVQPGVNWRGRVNRPTLYDEIFSSSIWFYPTDWPETSCQLAGSLIFTNNGIKKIEDIRVGDKVLTHKGRFKMVTKTIFKPYSGDIYSIKRVGDFNSITLTEEHPVFATRFNRRSDSKGNRIYNPEHKTSWWATPKTLQPRLHFLKSPKMEFGNRDHILLSHYINLEENDDGQLSSNHNQLRYKKVDNHVELTPEFLYCLGVFVADGSATPTQGKFFSAIASAHNRKDIHIAERFANFFGGKIVDVSENQVNTISHCAVWARFLNTVIGVGKNKKIPSFVFECSKELQQAFIDGYVDSDGYRDESHGTPRYKLDTISPSLAYGLSQLLCNQGIFASIGYRSAVAAYNLSWRLLPTTKFYTETSDGIYTRIESVTRLYYEGLVYNFEVDEDESYVTDRTAVHNCISSLEMQAGGVWPITNAFWALKDNVYFGDLFEGIPQLNELVKFNMIDCLVSKMGKRGAPHPVWGAINKYSWDTIADEWIGWI